MNDAYPPPVMPQRPPAPKAAPEELRAELLRKYTEFEAWLAHPVTREMLAFAGREAEKFKELAAQWGRSTDEKCYDSAAANIHTRISRGEFMLAFYRDDQLRTEQAWDAMETARRVADEALAGSGRSHGDSRKPREWSL